MKKGCLIFSIPIWLWIGWAIYSNVEDVTIGGFKEFGNGRYQFLGPEFIDERTGSFIEQGTYTYKKHFPYLYLYGEGGLSRVRYVDFFWLHTEILKIPTRGYYERHEVKYGKDVQGSWSDMRKKYRNRLHEMDAKDLSANDQEIFLELKERSEVNGELRYMQEI